MLWAWGQKDWTTRAQNRGGKIAGITTREGSLGRCRQVGRDRGTLGGGARWVVRLVEQQIGSFGRGGRKIREASLAPTGTPHAKICLLRARKGAQNNARPVVRPHTDLPTRPIPALVPWSRGCCRSVFAFVFDARLNRRGASQRVGPGRLCYPGSGFRRNEKQVVQFRCLSADPRAGGWASKGRCVSSGD